MAGKQRREESAYGRPEWADVAAFADRTAQATPTQRSKTFINDALWNLNDYKAILDFEATMPSEKRRSDVLHRNFKTTYARYYQALARVLLMPEALQHNPMVVNRLLAQNADRMAARANRTFGAHRDR